MQKSAQNAPTLQHTLTAYTHIKNRELNTSRTVPGQMPDLKFIFHVFGCGSFHDSRPLIKIRKVNHASGFHYLLISSAEEGFMMFLVPLYPLSAWNASEFSKNVIIVRYFVKI